MRTKYRFNSRVRCVDVPMCCGRVVMTQGGRVITQLFLFNLIYILKRLICFFCHFWPTKDLNCSPNSSLHHLLLNNCFWIKTVGSQCTVLHTLRENFILTSTDPATYLHFDLFWVQLHKNGCFWNNTNVDVNVSRQHLDHITHYISLPLHTTSYVVLPRTTRGQCGCFLEVTKEFVLITFRRNVIVNFYYAVKSHCEIMNHIHSATVSWSLWNVTYTWLQFMCGYVKWIIDEGRAYVGGRRWKTLLGMETWNYLLSLLPPRPTLSERKIHLV